jgi:NAD+ diphosphatase
VIVLIEHGNKVLLSRSPHFPKGMYSIQAGFVEPGENLEQAVEREILEEVGVYIENVTYFGSQPWPFPNSLMIGFTATYAGGELTIDKTEIEDAGWYTYDALPAIPPPLSIARKLIDHFVEKQKQIPSE